MIKVFIAECQSKNFHTSFHFLLDISNNQASFNVLMSLPIPPVTSSCGCLLAKPRQQAAWESLSTGQESPSDLWSLIITYNKRLRVRAVFHDCITVAYNFKDFKGVKAKQKADIVT